MNAAYNENHHSNRNSTSENQSESTAVPRPIDPSLYKGVMSRASSKAIDTPLYIMMRSSDISAKCSAQVFITASRAKPIQGLCAVWGFIFADRFGSDYVYSVLKKSYMIPMFTYLPVPII